MDSASVYDDLKEIFCDVLDLDDVTLTAATTAKEVDGWDSLSHIRLMVSVERHFRMKFSNAEIESLKSVGDLVGLITAKRA